VLVVVAVSVLLARAERLLAAWAPFAALVSAMAIGFVILEKREHMAHEISAKLAKVWVFAEIVLFAMVGAQVNIRVAWQAGAAGAALVLFGILARSLGTLLCLWRSNLNSGERLFVAVAYTPKATVQAAIGAAPLIAMRAAGMDTAPGEIILAVAVLSILLTAPAGAWAIAALGHRVLDIAPEALRDSADAAAESGGSEADEL
jgi:solute carrier family 9B (sodium/hydrogen exchanger), member 1/2